MNGDAERLREARAKCYPSAQAAAEAFGWTVSTYRSHENGTRGFSIDDAKRYGRAFKVNPGWLLGLDKIEAPRTISPLATNMIEVVGSVAAGTWVESLGWDAEDRFTIIVAGEEIPDARRFGLRVDGFSMDRFYAPGTILDCVSIFDLKLAPENDDHVIVERRRPDGLREFTVKRFHIDEDGRHWLIPESTKPEFQTPIEVGRPDPAIDDIEGITVIAFVIGSYQTRAARFAARLQHRF